MEPVPQTTLEMMVALDERVFTSEDRWCKGDFAQSKDFQGYLEHLKGFDQRAYRFCLFGGVQHLTGEHEGIWRWKINKAFSKAGVIDQFDDAADWNNNIRLTFKEFKEGLKKVIEFLSKLSEKEKNKFRSHRKCECGEPLVYVNGHSTGDLHTMCPKCKVCPDCDDGSC